MHRDGGWHRLELLEHDVEAPRHRVVARLDERLAAPQPRPLDARQVDRDPLAGLCPQDVEVVHLHAACTRTQARRLDPQLVAGRDRA